MTLPQRIRLCCVLTKISTCGWSLWWIFWQSSNQTAAPPFGTSASEYTDVKRFYDYWLGFSSTQTFARYEKYSLAEAPTRQIRRLMEKDNKKLRYVSMHLVPLGPCQSARQVPHSLTHSTHTQRQGQEGVQRPCAQSGTICTQTRSSCTATCRQGATGRPREAGQALGRRQASGRENQTRVRRHGGGDCAARGGPLARGRGATRAARRARWVPRRRLGQGRCQEGGALLHCVQQEVQVRQGVRHV